MILFIIGFLIGGAIGAFLIYGFAQVEIEELREICGDLCRRLEHEKWENRGGKR